MFLVALLNNKAQAQVSDPSAASTYDLQFTSPTRSCNTLCSQIQVKAAAGAADLAFGSHTIGFSYNAAAISQPSYTASSFNSTTVCSGPGGFNYSPYSTTNFSYSEIGIPAEANITTTLSFFIPGFQCPLIEQDWITMGEVCFTIVDDSQNIDLHFDSDLTLANKADNQPSHQEGTFSDQLMSPQSLGAQGYLVCLPVSIVKNP